MNQKYFTEEERKKAKKKRDKNYRENNKEKCLKRHKEYYQNNKKEINLKAKIYYQNNKENIDNYQKEYQKNNKIKILLQKRKYNTKYRKFYREEINEKIKNKRKNNIQYKLSTSLRSRLYKAIKNDYKSGSAVKDLGCSVPELKLYLEAKFQPGMSWDNWSFTGWHIDHIIPLDSFDLTNREELLKAVHYTNLQPMWAEENLQKNKFCLLNI